MIHIMRENETLDDVAEIYGVDRDYILAKNPPHTIYAQNCAVYIPSEDEIIFTDKDISSEEFSHIYGYDIKTLSDKNPHMGKIILKNSRILCPEKKSYDRRMFSSVYAVKNVNSDFTEIDRNHKITSKIYIDCYEITEDDFSLPVDYPSINACKINDISPCLYIPRPKEFSGEKIRTKIKQDLKYKSYEEVLINVTDINEIRHAEMLTEFFSSEGMKVSLKGNENILTEVKYSLYENLFYSPKRNTFDFTSFTEIITKLTKEIPTDILGYEFRMGAAIINKESMKILYPGLMEIRDIFYQNTPVVTYDELSKLCFFRYGQNNFHNVIYEDLRSVYSKAKYLSDKNITRYLLPELSKAIGETVFTGFCDCN